MKLNLNWVAFQIACAWATVACLTTGPARFVATVAALHAFFGTF